MYSGVPGPPGPQDGTAGNPAHEPDGTYFARARQQMQGRASCLGKRTSENFPSETVWKIGIGPETGLRERPRGVEGVPIRAPLAAGEAR